jgi:microsomal dipeptidase-like Zn-dependent dipeptidase
MLIAIEYSKVPVIFSDSGVYHICKSKRNIPDNIIELIPKHDGIIMVCALTRFLDENERILYDRIFRMTNSSSETVKYINEYYIKNPHLVI